MRLLITTQAVDLDDPVLGFFHRWIEELAPRFDHISVICLKEGRHTLPANVRVYSLGKESGRSRIKYISRFFKYIFALRNEYDAVFVHMNSEYVCLGGPLWRAWGKRIVLWRNHKLSGSSTWLAARFADTICYTSDSSYVARFAQSVRMPVGIDTQLFSPGVEPPAAGTLLFLGRLDEIKHPDVFLVALEVLAKEHVAFAADIIGDPTPGRETYAGALQERFKNAPGVSFRPGIRNDKTPEEYRSHAVYVNLTSSGSFDKTLIEAAASGCLVVCGNDAMHDVVPDNLFVDPTSPESVASGIEAALRFSTDERAKIIARGREYVIKQHSLALLTEKLVALLQP